MLGRQGAAIAYEIGTVSFVSDLLRWLHLLLP